MKLIKPHFLSELKKHRITLRNTHKEVREDLRLSNRFALWITHHVGTIEFFLIITLWTATWLLWNSFGPENMRFDAPSSGFVLWLFLSNVIQMILMPLIMVGQNVQARHAEAFAEHDYEINVKAEKEVEIILHHLEHLDKMMVMALEKLGVNMQEVLEKLEPYDAEHK
jgi:uncharacterized membrane protein